MYVDSVPLLCDVSFTMSLFTFVDVERSLPARKAQFAVSAAL